MRGPLDILKESWQTSSKSSESISYIMDMRKKLEEMQKLAGSNLQKAQEKQKACMIVMLKSSK